MSNSQAVNSCPLLSLLIARQSRIRREKVRIVNFVYIHAFTQADGMNVVLDKDVQL